MIDHADLIERLEKATEGSREMDRRLESFRRGRVVSDETFIYGPKDGTREITTVYPVLWLCFFAPRYTTSLDAALSLVPKGWSWRVSVSEKRQHPNVALGRSYPTNATILQEGRDVCATICAAALKARQVQENLANG